MLSPEEITWLQLNYPDLCYDTQRQRIVGELAFRMLYSKKPNEAYVINPDKSYATIDGTLIEDVYEIDIQPSTRGELPEVREIGGRITRSLNKWNIKNPADLHIYPNNTLCLCIPIEIDDRLPSGFNLQDFFHNLLIPYFYYQSYFEKFGQEPWKGYGHGDLGFLESFQLRCKKIKILDDETVRLYIDHLSENLQKMMSKNIEFKGHHQCFCGSGKIFRRCHKEAFWGYNQLRECYISYFGEN